MHYSQAYNIILGILSFYVEMSFIIPIPLQYTRDAWYVHKEAQYSNLK